jgi:hypothetical protein
MAADWNDRERPIPLSQCGLRPRSIRSRQLCNPTLQLVSRAMGIDDVGIKFDAIGDV